VIRKELGKVLKKTSVMVTRYDPLNQDEDLNVFPSAVPDQSPALERRVRQLENQLRALQATVEELRRRQGGR
jgi:hypothetical protein